jgi:DNA-directed RNA polymerase specialized sigma24 family protein
MTRHKVANQARRHRADMRDCRRVAACDPAYLDGRAAAPSPSRLVVGRELLAEVGRRLSEEERLLAELRAEGCAWTEIAARLGGTAEARRKQLARAVNRVEQQLEGSEIGDE